MLLSDAFVGIGFPVLKDFNQKVKIKKKKHISLTCVPIYSLQLLVYFWCLIMKRIDVIKSVLRKKLHIIKTLCKTISLVLGSFLL